MRQKVSCFPDECSTHDKPSPLYKKYGMGTTAFSCLARGLLTGKVSTHYLTLAG